MAITEPETSHDERGSQGESTYDGFISYSHAAHNLLAPRLQAGLQRFAVPDRESRVAEATTDDPKTKLGRSVCAASQFATPGRSSLVPVIGT